MLTPPPSLYPTHREIKKRILGMRGEEWGRIVVDGACVYDRVDVALS